jgi:hypothetical protein
MWAMIGTSIALALWTGWLSWRTHRNEKQRVFEEAEAARLRQVDEKAPVIAEEPGLP